MKIDDTSDTEMGINSIVSAWNEFKAFNDRRLQEIERKPSLSTATSDVEMVRELVVALRNAKMICDETGYEEVADECAESITKATTWLAEREK